MLETASSSVAYHSPDTKLPVRSRRKPITVGLIADARMPAELTRAIPAGRPLSERTVAGTVQKIAIAVNAPAVAHTSPSMRNVSSGTAITTIQPNAVSVTGRI